MTRRIGYPRISPKCWAICKQGAEVRRVDRAQINGDTVVALSRSNFRTLKKSGMLQPVTTKKGQLLYYEVKGELSFQIEGNAARNIKIDPEKKGEKKAVPGAKKGSKRKKKATKEEAA